MQTILSPQLQEATQSLIDNLLASEAFIHYQNTHSYFETDDEARTLLEQLTQAQARLRQRQVKGSVNQAEIDSLRLLQQRAQRNSAILDYSQSQQVAINFLREINSEISQLLGINFATFSRHSTC